jgi:hypothetical protein
MGYEVGESEVDETVTKSMLDDLAAGRITVNEVLSRFST